ncbi:MAG: DUF937 domain-containing protein [Chitinophagales bacterium]|nr:DUF937 domain-containing protein [Chitinophagales bacterium]MDW8418561.1 DUF937 domain-containing protein [Chitinophagales bacterium]
MLQQLIQLVQENAQDLIVKNPNVPDQFNDAAISEAGNIIQNQLAQAVKKGQLQDVLGMFGNQQGLRNNPVVSAIITQFAASLASKFGVNSSQAQQIAGQLIPQILGALVSKTNNPADNSFNINDIMSQLGAGGKGIDFGSVVTQMQQGGKVDFGSLAGQILGGGKSGGLGGLLGSLFKRK